ncbi:MAG: MBL fold metallo-hydrolase [Sphaerochaetaceae bacterium]|jgi:glyoxylase-like metal-dependent hydrolase (beta-lactamase superfamily II)|nr:MBL fold metallo-hydrolase [Sphaerochaetaceae bacterium]
MFIERLVVGPYETNCYILGEEETGSAWIIDPGAEAASIIEVLESRHVYPGSVLLTHGHWDHITALPELVKKYPELEIVVGADDAKYLGAKGKTNIQKDCSDKTFLQVFDKAFSSLPEPSILLRGRQYLQDCKLWAIPTPGHTPGGICYYSEEGNFLFSGDTLFAQSIGRTDFPGGSYEDIVKSCRSLMDLDDSVNVLPGHGPATTIRAERTNPYF